MRRHIDQFIAPSRLCHAIHTQRGFKGSVTYLPDFIPDNEYFAPSKTPSGPDTTEKPYFLYAGRLEKIKGLQSVIPIFRTYTKARLLIAGVGNHEPILRRAAAGCPNIKFLGLQNRRALSDLYRGALALIVPSICLDISPNVILEAFSHQTPVIVRNIGGMPELVAESGGGLIYDTETDLIRAMDRVAGHADQRLELGQQGLRASRRDFCADAHIERYLALIHRLKTPHERRTENAV
jgi:glycosyltransferase involved in cell wall biosynthesis